MVVLLSNLKLLKSQKGQPRTEKLIPDSVKNPRASQVSITMTVLLMKSKPLLNFWTRTIFLLDMDPATLMTLIHTTDNESMCNQYPETTTHQPRTNLCLLFSPLRPMDSKRMGLSVSFAIYQKKITDRHVNEPFPTFEEFNDLWKPGAMDVFSPVVVNCRCIQM